MTNDLFYRSDVRYIIGPYVRPSTRALLTDFERWRLSSATVRNANLTNAPWVIGQDAIRVIAVLKPPGRRIMVHVIGNHMISALRQEVGLHSSINSATSSEVIGRPSVIVGNPALLLPMTLLGASEAELRQDRFPNHLA